MHSCRIQTLDHGTRENENLTTGSNIYTMWDQLTCCGLDLKNIAHTPTSDVSPKKGVIKKTAFLTDA